MAKEKATILHRWFDEVWNMGRTEVIDEMIAPECVAVGLNAPSATRATIPPATGRVQEIFLGFHSAFPNIHITVQETVPGDDLVVAYRRITATQRGARALVLHRGFTATVWNRGQQGRCE